MAWKGVIGRSFSPESFDNYLHTLTWNAWRPSFLVLHNTAVPSLAQRPKGFTDQHIKNLEVFYRDQHKWKSGPHIFVDDQKIWVFTPLTVSGTHSPSWNKLSIGIEMLGDYSKESFSEGRGLSVRKNTVAAIASLCAVLGIDPETIKLHKEDKLTTHNCPGVNVKKSEIIAEVEQLMAVRHGGDH
jgi:N-acetylmuramoyl-L-alanine amidase CwlA